MRNVITPMRHPDFFHSTLLRQKRGVLLYGPPGTGEAAAAATWDGVQAACWTFGMGWCPEDEGLTGRPSDNARHQLVAGWGYLHAQDRVRHVSPCCHG